MLPHAEIVRRIDDQLGRTARGRAEPGVSGLASLNMSAQGESHSLVFDYYRKRVALGRHPKDWISQHEVDGTGPGFGPVIPTFLPPETW